MFVFPRQRRVKELNIGKCPPENTFQFLCCLNSTEKEVNKLICFHRFSVDVVVVACSADERGRNLISFMKNMKSDKKKTMIA